MKYLDDSALEMLCMDCLNEVLVRFGSRLGQFLERAVRVLTALLKHPLEGVRSRASVTLAPVAALLDPEHFDRLLNTIIQGMSSSSAAEGSQDALRADVYIQCIGEISRVAGNRIGEYLGQILPLLFSILDTMRPDEEASSSQVSIPSSPWKLCCCVCWKFSSCG